MVSLNIWNGVQAVGRRALNSTIKEGAGMGGHDCPKLTIVHALNLPVCHPFGCTI